MVFGVLVIDMTNCNKLVTELLGTKLQIQTQEKIGVVQNVAINTNDGTITFIFLCYANFFGKIHRHFAIPREEVDFVFSGENFFFEIKKEKLVEAARYTTRGNLKDFSPEYQQIQELNISENNFTLAYQW
ncbi:PRC-barrel domain-containing protein [Aliifodinibius sp. S!AR15-10]|uniref:PRC-barrel domain-containing protein n=1 Tax=Aliifodinibius sp. S!AR15-10 TaxID=2950437 RepID=UPI002858A291|nr:PRC-barrel domain-containing protein [Aliifodinibius sp. S!AR15-10]MDR8390443.1 PRC-barrel domain-containing protein [Aliifodinibius sp. S!AR15-10]